MDLKYTLARFLNRVFLERLILLRSPQTAVLLAASFMLIALTLLPTVQAASQEPLSDSLVFTEFQYDPPGQDKEREWVELANLSEQPVHLAGYGLGDEELPGAGEGMLRFPGSSTLDAGEVIVVAQTAVGFRALFGVNPEYEIVDSDTSVPDMIIDNQWATGQFALANDGDEILLIDEQDNLVDSLNYGDANTYFSPSIPLAAGGQSIERIPAVCDTDSAVDWRPQQYPNPGKVQIEGTCSAAPDTASLSLPAYRPIGEIQGPGAASPLLNQIVSFRGIVTGAMEDQNASGIIFHTMFVQDVPGLEDSDSATSDGIAVFLGRHPPKYQPGDQISVTGQVTEFYGLTEIDDTGLSIELEQPSQAMPDPVLLNLPQDSAAAAHYLEKLESMLVESSEALPIVGPTHSGCGFALGSAPAVNRVLRYTEQEISVPPILVLSQSDVDCSDLPAVKTGDYVSGITGPVTYHFDRYKVVQQSNEMLNVEIVPAVITDVLSAPADDTIRIATMNLDNFLTPESGVSIEDSDIKKRKLAYTIGHTLGCPELVGVQEVETKELLLDLADKAAGLCGFTYDVTHLDSADGRGIDVALLSDPQQIKVESAKLRQTCSPVVTGIYDNSIQCMSEEEPLFSRPPLEVLLRVDGESITLFVNHFKSKRGGEQETASRRLAQAGHVNDLVRKRLSSDPESAIIVLGDFNDYNLSAVWWRLVEGGVLIDAMQHVPVLERYSYIFDGVSQLVDGILVSPALAHRIENVVIAHVNADYPAVYAFDDSPPTLPFHSSDHDPVLLTLSVPSHSTAIETLPASKAAPTGGPSAVEMATAVIPTPTAESSPTVEPNEPAVSQEESRSLGYLFPAGVALLIAATVILWWARRISK